MEYRRNRNRNRILVLRTPYYYGELGNASGEATTGLAPCLRSLILDPLKWIEWMCLTSLGAEA